MSGVSPVAAYSLAQPSLLTPSPFSFSFASTSWSSRHPIHLSTLFLRFLTLLSSFVSALSLTVSSTKKNTSTIDSNFSEHPGFMYCFIVAIVVFLYSAYQLFKGVCDIAYRGIVISDKTSDYISFVLDQLSGYLLISSSSVVVLEIQQIEQSASLWKAAIVSVSMNFASFLLIACCALLSGYKLCKRITW